MAGGSDLVTIIGGYAGWASAVLVFASLEWQRRKRRKDIEYHYDGLRSYRRTFGTILRQAYTEHRNTNPHLPELGNLIMECGKPPGIYPRTRPISNWWQEGHHENLCERQRNLLTFLSRIYPQADGSRRRTPDHTFMARGRYELFDESRAKLASFWSTHARRISKREYKHTYNHEDELILLLGWLDLAIAGWNPHQGRGRVDLYRFITRTLQTDKPS